VFQHGTEPAIRFTLLYFTLRHFTSVSYEMVQLGHLTQMFQGCIYISHMLAGPQAAQLVSVYGRVCRRFSVSSYEVKGLTRRILGPMRKEVKGGWKK
jgi:hypothetical protein